MAQLRSRAEPAATAVPVTTEPSQLADPAPLGLAGFAGTTFFLSVVNTNMVGHAVLTGVLGLALFYGGLAQLLAGMWEFVRGNTFGALAFSSFGAFWLSYWYLVDHVLPHLPSTTKATDISHAVGVYLLVWTIFTAYMTVAATRVSVAVLAVFVTLTLTFLALTIGAFASSTGWDKVGGWLGIITAVFAWYASFAGVTNSTFRRQMLPVLPR